MYTLALVAYAHSLYDVTSSKRAHIMAELEDRAVVEGNTKFWTSGLSERSETHYGANNARSIDIETTAYALLAYTAPGAKNAIENGLPLVFWLSRQRNPAGGFSSTQVRDIKTIF